MDISICKGKSSGIFKIIGEHVNLKRINQGRLPYIHTDMPARCLACMLAWIMVHEAPRSPVFQVHFEGGSIYKGK